MVLAPAAPGAAPAPGRCRAEPVLVEYARSFFPIILVVLVIRSFLFEPFRIPSDSMMPTLLDGDFIFVNKFTYGLRLPVVEPRDRGRWASPARRRRGLPPAVRPLDQLHQAAGRACRVTTSWCSDKRVYINGELQAVTLDGIYRRVQQHSRRAGRQSSGSARSTHRMLYIAGRPSVDFDDVVPAGTTS